MNSTQPPTELPKNWLQHSMQALIRIARQRPDDAEAQRRSQIAINLFYDNWSSAGFPKDLIGPYTIKSGLPIPSLSTEVYEIILDFVIYESINFESTSASVRPGLEYLGRLFDVCPKVTKLSLKAETPFGRLESESSECFSKSWKQLRHLDVLGDTVASDIIELSKQCPSLQSLKIDDNYAADDSTATLEGLLDASQVLGKALKTLYVSLIMQTQSNSTTHQLLGRLPVIEEFFLGEISKGHSTIHALARLNPSRLKRFKMIRMCHDYIAPPGLEEAICQVIAAHADTLESISIFTCCDLNMRVLEQVKKAKKLRFFNLRLPELLTDEEFGDLVAACPKLETCTRSYSRMTHQKKYTESVWPHLDDVYSNVREEKERRKLDSWGIVPGVREDTGPEISNWIF
ncbi:hypothetical protein FGADI_13556 [Fusarium gaditjirri]|uniref:RNI-like protein n=1 Tax=Fusarium gaditjirri TaxID=282569 RepID=A0A8H4WM47_9HYPO|nr:hypothetical protein FGADI_13556 [Fusarium gaditjirri]